MPGSVALRSATSALALDGMLKDASGRKFDVVMAWAIDRLGRSLEVISRPAVDPRRGEHVVWPLPPAPGTPTTGLQGTNDCWLTKHTQYQRGPSHTYGA